MGFLIMYCICSLLRYPISFLIGSRSIWYLATSVVINRYRTARLTKISAAIFQFSESVGLPHIAYIMVH